MKKGNGYFLLTLGIAAMLLGGCSGRSDPEPAQKESPTPEFSSFNSEVEIICPWAPGGSADVNARRLSQIVGEKIGQVVMVTNQTGAGGAVGFSAQKEAEPDGYTLGIVTAELNTLLAQGKADYKLEDFYPIIRMNTIPACVAVPADSPFQTLEELLAYAKEHPEELRTGDVGIGSIWHICAAKLEEAAGVKFSHVSFEGAALAAVALTNGELDLVTLEPSVFQPYVEEGKARILAVMSEERLKAFEQYPTCKELGYPIVAGSFQGIVCPSDVPDERKAELERLFTEAYESEEYQNFCEEYGVEKSFLNSADFQTFLEEDLEHVKENLKEMGLDKK